MDARGFEHASLTDLFGPYEAAQLLLAETGLSDISKTLLAGTTGLAVQALVTGSVLQLVHRYFRRQTRLAARSAIGSGNGQDPPLARAGVIWLTALICLHVVVVYVMNMRLLLMSQQFTGGYLMDFFLGQVSNLIFTVVILPIFVFFAFRAWNLWSRRKSVMALCVAAVTPAVGLGLAAAGFGLQHPYPLEAIDNQAFAAWLPFVTMTIQKLRWVTLGSAIAQFLAACIFSSLICAGLFAHRNCCALMPGYNAKIAFVVGESLIPLVITSGAILAGDILTKVSTSSIGGLISRAVHSCAPAIYFHCLMNSLTSAQRHRDALRASMSHHHGHDDGTELHEKHSGFEEEHPEDLDTPVQIEDGGNPSGSKGFNFPYIFTTRPSISAGDSQPAAADGKSSKFLGFSMPSAFTRPAKHPEEPEDHYTLRSAGSGRRSSLARACSYSSSKAAGLSIKLQNKLPASFQPALNRRESEQIFAAHEEFEGLPHTPGDVGLGLRTPRKQSSLNDIDEGSDAAVTPAYYTPPRIASPMFGSEWDKHASAMSAKSPESVYEGQVGRV